MITECLAFKTKQKKNKKHLNILTFLISGHPVSDLTVKLLRPKPALMVYDRILIFYLIEDAIIKFLSRLSVSVNVFVCTCAS